MISNFNDFLHFKRLSLKINNFHLFLKATLGQNQTINQILITLLIPQIIKNMSNKLK